MQDAPTAPSCKSSEPKHESVRCLARLSALHRPSGADPQGSFLQKTVRQSIPESDLRLRSNRPRGPWSREGPFQELIESRLDSYKEKSNRLVYILQALPPLSSPPTMGLGLGRGRYAIGQINPKEKKQLAGGWWSLRSPLHYYLTNSYEKSMRQVWFLKPGYSFRRLRVEVRPALFHHRAQILAQLLHSGTPDIPPAPKAI